MTTLPLQILFQGLQLPILYLGKSKIKNVFLKLEVLLRC